jgi:vacuolar-type H+-ATPase subunit H
MKRFLLITVLALALSLMVTTVALASNGEPDESVSTGEIALLLAPLVAAATAIERFIEMCFNQVESSILTVGKTLRLGGQHLKFVRGQVKDVQKSFETLREDVRGAEKALVDATKKVMQAQNDEVLEEAKKELKDAENRLSAFDSAEDVLEDAQNRVVEFLKSPYWVSRKQAIATLAGIVLGLIVAFAGQIRMFGLLGIDLARGFEDKETLMNFLVGVDIAITGLVIGTGSGPVHSLITLLQNTKDAVGKAGKLWKGRALSEALGEEVGTRGFPRRGEEPPAEGEARRRRRIERMLR